MRVHVIGAVLRVVLQNEDRRILPVPAGGDRFDDPAQRQVVLRDHGARRRIACARVGRMVPSQAQDREARQIAVLFKLPKLLQPDVHAAAIGGHQVEGRVIGIDRAFEPGHRGHEGARHGLVASGLGRLLRWRLLAGRAHELAVAPHGNAGAAAGVPDVSQRGRVEVAVRVAHLSASLGEVGTAAVGIVHRPDPFDGVGRVGARRVGVAVVADLRVHVEVVEQHELAGERVRIGRHVLAEEAERRIAVSLGDVPEDLVVGAVLPDDVEDVLDRRGGAHAPRDRRPRRRPRR